jgi:hypothetical protein
VTFEVNPGDHQLSAQMDWASSAPLQIHAKADAAVHVYTRLRWLTPSGDSWAPS